MIRSLIFLTLVALSYFQYQSMANALPEIAVETGEIEIKAYTDRILLTFPITVRNAGYIEATDIALKIYLDNTYIEQRKVGTPLSPGEGTSLVLEEVTILNDVLNDVILANIKSCPDCPPEDMSLEIKVEANLPLHTNLRLDVPKGKAEQGILLRRLMGGRTKEEFAEQLAQQLANRTSG